MHLTASYMALAAALLATPGLAQPPELVDTPQSESPVSIRLMFGADRHTPQRWDGSVAVTGGRVLHVSGVHFEGRDEIVGQSGWKLTNRVTRYADSTTQRGYDPVHTRPFAMIPNGVVATVEAAEASEVEVTTEQGAFSFSLRELPFGQTLEFLGGTASAQRIPTTADITGGETENDYPALTTDADGTVWISWISYQDERDSVWLAHWNGSGWVEPIQVSPTGYIDNFRTAIAADASGGLVVVWSGKAPTGSWGIFSRRLSDGALSAATSLASEGPNLYLQAAADSQGKVHVVWQGFRDRIAQILYAQWDGSQWSAEAAISDSSADSWAPAIAADSAGGVWAGWDGYHSGDFNVYVRHRNAGGAWQPQRQVTRSLGFDANISLACDSADRLWMAWDHGEANWGKDWSSQRFRPGGGAGLYRVRSVKVAVLEGDRVAEATGFMGAVPPASKDYMQQARLIVDGSGHVWAMARSLTSTTTRVDNNWGAGGIWEMLLARLDENGWSPVTKLHATNGRNDVWAAATVDGGGKLWFAWSRDARPFGSPRRSVNRGSPQAQTTHVSHSVIDPSHAAWRGSGEPKRSEFSEPVLGALPVHANEEQDTAAIRAYRYEVGGSTYRILRGDLHRHTDISADGIGEGGLIDFYRYAFTAGQFDFMMVGDHQYGGNSVPGVEYNWWRTEKSEDIFLVDGRFWPLFGTERSVTYPNGHRNTVFAQRGVRWMPIQAGERNGSINTGEVLFPYLRRYGGISTPHTSGSEQGTDWRERDEELEPIVEIYQSLHASYEYPGAPRAETPDKRYYHHGEPWLPKGFVWNAWAKGIKIGVQASSDHVGTHDSYACVLVPGDKDITRQDLIDAMKRRHTYAATDNIILDMRIGEHIMGDAFATSEQPVVRAKVVGTGPIKRVVLIKNNKIVYTDTFGAKEVAFEYRDDSAQPGDSYYYIRAEQADGSLAWGSPIWVSYR